MIRYFRRYLDFCVLVTSFDLKFEKSAFDHWKVRPIKFDIMNSTTDRRMFRKFCVLSVRFPASGMCS